MPELGSGWHCPTQNKKKKMGDYMAHAMGSLALHSFIALHRERKALPVSRITIVLASLR